MSLEFFGTGTNPMTEGRVAIKAYMQTEDEVNKHRLLIIRRDEKTLRVVPYTREIDDFFRNLPYNDRLKLTHYDRILTRGVDDQIPIEGAEDSSKVFMRSLDAQGRLYYDKRVPDQTIVTVRGMSGYLEIEFPESLDKILVKKV